MLDTLTASGLYIAIVANFLVVCAVEGSGRDDETVNCGAFSIIVPGGLTVTKKSPVEDFELLTIAKGDKVFVTVYLGNHPAFPTEASKKSTGELREARLGNVDVLTVWHENELQRQEMKIQLDTERWPMFLHVFTGAKLSRADTMAAVKIISSIRVGHAQKK